jgi:hypothetical protein
VGGTRSGTPSGWHPFWLAPVLAAHPFWHPFWLSTVGRDETLYRRYIRRQEVEDQRQDQLNPG